MVQNNSLMTIMFFFIPVKHSLSSSALERLQKGYDYAENNIIWLGDLKQDETIKFVTHTVWEPPMRKEWQHSY